MDGSRNDENLDDDEWALLDELVADHEEYSLAQQKTEPLVLAALPPAPPAPAPPAPLASPPAHLSWLTLICLGHWCHEGSTFLV